LKNIYKYYKHLSKLQSLKSDIKLFYKEFTVDLDKSCSDKTLENPNLVALLALIFEVLFNKVKLDGIVCLSTLFEKIVIKSSTI
jgi:hypothetical protein